MDKDKIQRQILEAYPGTIPDMDIDWDMGEIFFKAGEDQGYRNGSISGYNEATQKGIKAMNEVLVTGAKLGKKEVAEWVNRHCMGCRSNTPSNTDEYLGFHKESWQAFLTGKGIKEAK